MMPLMNCIPVLSTSVILSGEAAPRVHPALACLPCVWVIFRMTRKATRQPTHRWIAPMPRPPVEQAGGCPDNLLHGLFGVVGHLAGLLIHNPWIEVMGHVLRQFLGRAFAGHCNIRIMRRSCWRWRMTMG
jgi:hypothetical protein